MEIDTQKLRRELDKVMAKVFIGQSSAFLGSIMCGLDVIWDRSIPTAATNGLKLWWNPDFFESCDFETNLTVLKHELWHPASLHMLRMKDRDPKLWNIACDIRINNDLENEKGNKVGKDWYVDHSVDRNGKTTEEDIYDLLHSNSIPMPKNGSFGDPGGEGDMRGLPKPGEGEPDDGHPSQAELTPAEQAQLVANVVAAKQAATLANQAGNIPGGVEDFINDFLAPVIPWERQLMKFFTDLNEEDYSWSRPNRRYSDIYLPTMVKDESRLQHLNFYFDVSCSVTDDQAARVVSEVKYIQEVIQPTKLSLIQFDTKIQHEDQFELGDVIDGLTIHGRGGTCLKCVHKHIEADQPSAVVIFSDLFCRKMDKLPSGIPVIWVCIGNPSAEVDFGELIHIKE